MAPPKSRLLRGLRRAHGLVAMNLGRIGSAAPLSTDWGFDRGKPIDRHYIESFLAAHAKDIRGSVLEVAEDLYSRRFGGDRVTRQDILDVAPGNPRATITGDLADPVTLPVQRFDCIILTQTLHLIFDMPSAIANLRRSLCPGGILLITVPGITPVDRGAWKDNWYWSLTDKALERLLSPQFAAARIEVATYGNLHAATAFLHGAAVQEVGRRKLDRHDPAYPVTVAARAVA